MRTLIATAMSNSKGKDIYCGAKKVSDQHLDALRKAGRQQLESLGFTFIRLISLDFTDVRGYAIFFEGHLDEALRAINNLNKNYSL